jgi:hypothetical protein
MTLHETLELVGPLDDSADENAAEDHFRAHLAKSVTTLGAMRFDKPISRRATGRRVKPA